MKNFNGYKVGDIVRYTDADGISFYSGYNGSEWEIESFSNTIGGGAKLVGLPDTYFGFEDRSWEIMTGDGEE